MIIKLAYTLAELGVVATSPFVPGFIRGFSSPDSRGMKFSKSALMGGAIGNALGIATVAANKGGGLANVPIFGTTGAIAGTSSNVGARWGRAIRQSLRNREK